MRIPSRGGLSADTLPVLQAPLSWRAGAATSPSQQLLSFRRRDEIARPAMSEHGAEELARETRRRDDDKNLLVQDEQYSSDESWNPVRAYTSSLGPPPNGAWLKRDYATYDIDQGSQQGRGIQSSMSPDPRPKSPPTGPMFMSPQMQQSLLPSLSIGEKQAQQAQQANQQAQNQRQAQRSPAQVELAKTQAQAQAKASQDQASQRAMNIASGAGQESTGSGITDSDTVPSFKFDPNLAPPGMPPQFYPQNIITNPRGEPMMRPPTSRPLSPKLTPAQMEAMRIGQMQQNGWRGPQPGMLGPGGQQILRPKAPNVNASSLTPAQKEAIRNSGSQQTTPAHVSSENARIQASDGLHDRSPGIMDERTACSGYRSFRGELKYTISEDRTTDAFKRRKVQFMALGQPLNRPVKAEPVPSRGAQITAREQRKDGFENVEETRNRSDEFVPSDISLRQQRNIEVYAESLAHQHRIAVNDTSTTQGMDSGVSIDNSEQPPRSLHSQQKAGENQLRNRASDRNTSRQLSQRADYLRLQLSNPALRATGPPGSSLDHGHGP